MDWINFENVNREGFYLIYLFWDPERVNRILDPKDISISFLSRLSSSGCNAGAEPVIPPFGGQAGANHPAGGRQCSVWTKFADFCVTCAHNGRCGQPYPLTSNPLKGTIVRKLRGPWTGRQSRRVAPGTPFTKKINKLPISNLRLNCYYY